MVTTRNGTVLLSRTTATSTCKLSAARNQKLNSNSINKINPKKKKITRKKSVCGWCNEVFSSRQYQAIHEVSHCPIRKAEMEKAGTTRKLFICTKCSTTLSSRSCLRKHHRRFHDPTNPKKKKTKKTTVCGWCKKEFKLRSSQQSHERNHCKVRKAEMEKAGIPKELFTCSKCSAVFDYKKGVQEHERRGCKKNVILKTRVCGWCKKEFKLRQTQQAHERKNCPVRKAEMEKAGIPKELFTCSKCSAVYSCKETIQRHERLGCIRKERKKVTQRIPVCGWCNKVFTSRQYQTVHELNYCPIRKAEMEKAGTTRQLFICTKCSAIHSSRSNLRRHHRRSCNPAKPKNKDCAHCLKSFSTLTIKRRHENSCKKRPTLLFNQFDENFPCHLCCEIKKNREEISTHMEENHEIKISMPATLNHSSSSKNSFPNGIFVCCYCQISFGDYEICRIHIEKCVISSSESCEAVPNRSINEEAEFMEIRDMKGVSSQDVSEEVHVNEEPPEYIPRLVLVM